MRKTTSFLLFVGLVAVSVTNCGSGQRSATLSRATALALLRKKPELLAHKEKKALVVQLPYWIRRASASDDELAARVPFALPDLNKLQEWGFDPDSGDYHMFVMGHFLIHAARAGLFFKQREVFRGGPGDGGVLLAYAQIPHSDIEWQTSYGYTFVYATIARPTFGEVTGIHQVEGSAAAEVQIVYVPTDAYRDLSKIAAETMKDLGRDPGAFSAAAGLAKLCGEGCDFLEKVPNSSATFSFAKYDDGWRVAQ